MKNLKPVLLVVFVALISPLHAADYNVTSAQDIADFTDRLRPGDNVILSDGIRDNQTLTFRGKGTAAQPITLRAATPGQAIFTGKSSLTIEGEHLGVSGLWLKDNAATGDSISVKGNHCRLTQCAIIGGTSKFFVHLRGTKNRVDHCYLAGKTSEGPTLQIEAEEEPNYHQIEWNHFGPRVPLGENGGETIRIGYSHQSMNNSRTMVENNLFDRCDGEIEIISNKSCENIFRANTFRGCAGMLTLRHGNRCVVDGNFFLGQGKKDSGGIRIIGEDHIVANNYIEGVKRGGFWITSGVPNSPLNRYFQARGVLIAFNTIVNSSGPYLNLDNGFGTSDRSLRPENITIANNLFEVPPTETLLKGTEGEGFRWLNNFASILPASRDGFRIANLQLQRAADGLWRPQENSPTRYAAKGDFPQIKTDSDGQLRLPKTDVGCDQISNAPIIYKPLQAADVGASWLKP